MQSQAGKNKVFVALCVNAGILALILLALWSRDSRVIPFSPSAAFGQVQAPIAGGGGIFVMPAQLSSTTWGCYLMDIDNQTLCVYQYSPGEKMLRFAASRTFKYDRRIEDFNTLPAPAEMKDLAARQQESQRAVQQAPAKSPEAPKEQ